MTGTLTPCPTPWKRRYWNRQEAKAHARKNHWDTHPYRCVCGNFHLGHANGLTRAEHRAYHGYPESRSETA